MSPYFLYYLIQHQPFHELANIEEVKSEKKMASQISDCVKELAEGDWIWREFGGKDYVRLRGDGDRVYTYFGIELGVYIGLFIVEKEG